MKALRIIIIISLSSTLIGGVMSFNEIATWDVYSYWYIIEAAVILTYLYLENKGGAKK